ncbi:MAG: hypothetical protein JW997_07540 [Actinobacteria bacterium]|nr:hypothetical protein [Actinomycetota bacterium]
MKRHILYAVLPLITILLLFVTAATCSFCGIQLDTNTSGQADSGSEHKTENNASEPVHVQDTETDESDHANGEDSADENTSVDEEHLQENDDSSVENDNDNADEPEADQSADDEEQVDIIEEIVIGVVNNETGCINTGSTSGDAAYTEYIFIGDSTDGGSVAGFLSFDITGLEGLEIVSAALNMHINEEIGDDLSFLGYLRIGAIQYGTGTLKLSDGNIPAELLIQLPNHTTNIRYGDSSLADELQKNINALNERLQFKIWWSNPGSNDDNDADGLKYMKEDVWLTIQIIE